MIESLHIQNLGVIPAASVELSAGLTVLTGQTGAGKTMVLNSLQLLRGMRADPALVSQGSARATVDAEISDLPLRAQEIVEEVGGSLDQSAVLVSRLVPSEGRSKAVLGGRAVPASTLAEFSSQIVIIHGQSEQLTLRSSARQRELVDTIGGDRLRAVLKSFQAGWDTWLEKAKLLRQAQEQASQLEHQRQYLQQSLNQIESLELQADEDDLLRSKLERLTHVEQLRQGVSQALNLLSGTEDGATTQLGQAREALRDIAGVDETLSPLVTELDGAFAAASETASSLRNYLDQLEANPEELEETHRRLAEIKQALSGKAVGVNELLSWAEKARQELVQLQDCLDLDRLSEEVQNAHEQAAKLGDKLSAERRWAADELEKRVGAELPLLALPQARIRVRLEPTKPSREGFDRIELELQTHPQSPWIPVAQAASGGELSRLMLAVELARQEMVEHRPTMIFDEVDSGVGGEAGLEIGRRLAILSKQCQVLVVTHLAQVAAWADRHLVVTKDGASSTVKEVRGEAREAEIARMLSGHTDLGPARQHAAELIQRCYMG